MSQRRAGGARRIGRLNRARAPLPPTRVLLVDDHDVMRQGLRMLLQSNDEIEVIADLESARDAITMAPRLRPDVVLMDVVMPGLNGLDATARLLRELSSVRVVMLSGFVEEEQLLQALRAGASGYLNKGAGADELFEAVRTVHGGGQYFSRDLGEAFDIPSVVARAKEDQPMTLLDELTAREREVLQLMAEGLTNREMAEELVISVKTVETHKTHITEKLGTKKKPEIIRIAMRAGLVNMDGASERQEAVDRQARHATG